MSAVGPLPSFPSAPNGPPRNGSTGGNMNGGGGGGGGDRVFVHIQDLQTEALSTFSITQSIGHLLQHAEQALQQAKAHIDFRRPDHAYMNYIRAFEIAVNVIPSHRDSVHFLHDQHGEERLRLLQRKINAMGDQFGKIKQIIVNNNSRSGVVPRGSQQGTAYHTRNGSENVLVPSTQKVKPSVSPKPDSLHSRAVSSVGPVANGSSFPPSAEALSDRFAKLRGFGQSESSRPSSRGSVSSVQGVPLSMPGVDPGNWGNTFSRPHGPRGMPETGNGPPRPSKLPLDTDFAIAMPKPPSPTYSPARNMQTTGNIPAPRHSARSLASSSSRKASTGPYSSASYTAPNGGVDYFSTPVSSETAVATPLPTPLGRKKSVHMPLETRITAEKLYDYLERFNVLLIDFRPRDDFDQGHIYTRNVICIEPLAIRPGISAEEVYEGLVLSPEEEQDMFYNRDQYDVVVYLDASTESGTYLSKPSGESEMKLKCLHEALYDFNQDKPLQRPPILLIGGIAAWVDLLGNQALRASSTKVRSKQGRPLTRRPAQRDGAMRLPKRRLRDYNPLDPEEEKSWRDRAKSESVREAPPAAFTSEGEVDSDGQSVEDHYPSIEDFNAQFPDVATIENESRKALSHHPVEHAVNIPQYPQRPPPSVYQQQHPGPTIPPQVPTRPAPAAPRMGYTGVSDRAVSQNMPAPRNSSTMVPYISPKYFSENLRLPRTGLKNFGSTCYMNATLQALSATTPLTVLFLDDGFKKLVQKENWKGSHGLLPEMYSNVVRELWKDNVHYIAPTTFFRFCGRINSTFSDPDQQQDAQEFFSFVVDCLHEDFNAFWSKTPLRVLTAKEEAQRERSPRLLVAKMEWARYIYRENSVITSLFYGQQSSRVRCRECKTTSTQYDPWALLQIEIPEVKEARLQDCLRNHFRDESLDDENHWTCPNCKVPRRADKKMTITRAPPCLVIGFKRFKTNPRTGDQRKIHTAVRFPLEGLDMGEFVLPPSSAKEEWDIKEQYGKDSLEELDAGMRGPFIYDAYAVVRHSGNTTRSGHYTAVVKDRARGVWRKFNDRTVSDVGLEKLNSKDVLDNDEAYLVFYQRREISKTGEGRL